MPFTSFVPRPPRSDVLELSLVEVLKQGGERVLPGFHRRRAEAECQHEWSIARLEIDFTGDRSIAVLCSEVSAVEPFVGVQLLPSIRETHESDRSGKPGCRR